VQRGDRDGAKGRIEPPIPRFSVVCLAVNFSVSDMFKVFTAQSGSIALAQDCLTRISSINNQKLYISRLGARVRYCTGGWP
jgi:hypothetical protein